MTEKPNKTHNNTLNQTYIHRSFTYKEASSDEPSHEPDLEGDLIIFQFLPIGEEQQQVGDHADERGRQQNQAHQAGTLPRTTHVFTFCCLIFLLPLFLYSHFEYLSLSKAEKSKRRRMRSSPLTLQKSNTASDS